MVFALHSCLPGLWELFWLSLCGASCASDLQHGAGSPAIPMALSLSLSQRAEMAECHDLARATSLKDVLGARAHLALTKGSQLLGGFCHEQRRTEGMEPLDGVPWRVFIELLPKVSRDEELSQAARAGVFIGLARGWAEQQNE